MGENAVFGPGHKIIDNNPRRDAGDSGVVLEDLEDAQTLRTQQGDVSNIREGSRTPWGQADYVDHTAPGIVVVGTPGHGGVKLSSERNKVIPVALRTSSGWYEEDCEWAIAALYHPDGFPYVSDDLDAVREIAKQTVIRWSPDEYEKVTGEHIPVGASYVKDERLWNEAHAEDEIGGPVYGYEDVTPDGMVAVEVKKGGYTGSDERVILVPRSDLDDLANKHPLGSYHGRFVVDPSKGYQVVTQPTRPPAEPRPRYRGIDTSKLTPGQRNRAVRDLWKLWRLSDGDLRVTREIIENGGISGKSSYRDSNGRKVYYLLRPEETEGAPGSGEVYVLPISKALWLAVDAPES
jgi:hypothetical protein